MGPIQLVVIPDDAARAHRAARFLSVDLCDEAAFLKLVAEVHRSQGKFVVGSSYGRAMTDDDETRVATAEREVAAPADRIFELIADPEQQPRWDGMDNLVEAAPGQRVHAVGDVFTMLLHTGSLRENHVVEFE